MPAKNKSINSVNIFLNKLLIDNFTRSDLIIGIGGGVTGDIMGFVSIFKRINAYKYTYHVTCSS